MISQSGKLLSESNKVGSLSKVVEAVKIWQQNAKAYIDFIIKQRGVWKSKSMLLVILEQKHSAMGPLVQHDEQQAVSNSGKRGRYM